MAEEHPESVASLQHKLQQIIVSVARTHSRAPVHDVEDVLTRAIHGAGIPEQPHKWVSDTAREIADGRLVVMNPREDEQLGLSHADRDRDPRGT